MAVGGWGVNDVAVGGWGVNGVAVGGLDDVAGGLDATWRLGFSYCSADAWTSRCLGAQLEAKK